MFHKAPEITKMNKTCVMTEKYIYYISILARKILGGGRMYALVIKLELVVSVPERD